MLLPRGGRPYMTLYLSSSSAKADDPVSQSVGDGSRSRGVLDTPHTRGMTAYSRAAPVHDIAGRLERFRAKWIPVRLKKTRQNKNLEPRSDSIGTETALAPSSVSKCGLSWSAMSFINSVGAMIDSLTNRTGEIS